MLHNGRIIHWDFVKFSLQISYPILADVRASLKLYQVQISSNQGVNFDTKFPEYLLNEFQRFSWVCEITS